MKSLPGSVRWLYSVHYYLIKATPYLHNTPRIWAKALDNSQNHLHHLFQIGRVNPALLCNSLTLTLWRWGLNRVPHLLGNSSVVELHHQWPPTHPWHSLKRQNSESWLNAVWLRESMWFKSWYRLDPFPGHIALDLKILKTQLHFCPYIFV